MGVEQHTCNNNVAVPLRLSLGETATSVTYNIEPGGRNMPNSVPMN